MEQKFYTDDFEQFLKETADDFRMYPSKRVWNSLYNNLHPGRKWPSLSVCLLLVSSIIFVGLSHKNEINGSSNTPAHLNDAPLIASINDNGSANQTLSPVTKVIPLQKGQANLSPGKQPNRLVAASDNKRQSIVVSPQVVVKAQASSGSIESKASPRNIMPGVIEDLNDHNGLKPASKFAASKVNTSLIATEGETNEIGIATGLQKNEVAIITSLQENHSMRIIEKDLPAVHLPLLKQSKTAEKAWIDDYAFHNCPIPTLKSRLKYEVYITPSVGFRKLEQTASYKSPPARTSLVTAIPDGPNPLEHNASFNLEAGYGYIYTKSKKLQFKAGVQLNYTSYQISAHQLGHSTTTNLLLKDSYSANGVKLSQRFSSLANLANNGNDNKLNNSTFQVSLPLGADIKFAGKHNLQWFVGATVQPTYVLFGNAYLISADFKNYVYDSKSLRKWNLNGALEAFLSYKTKKGIIFNAGPQFRYQFFSTYKSKYSFDENLYSLGLKFGMIRNF